MDRYSRGITVHLILYLERADLLAAGTEFLGRYSYAICFFRYRNAYLYQAYLSEVSSRSCCEPDIGGR